MQSYNLIGKNVIGKILFKGVCRYLELINPVKKEHDLKRIGI